MFMFNYSTDPGIIVSERKHPRNASLLPHSSFPVLVASGVVPVDLHRLELPSGDLLSSCVALCRHLKCTISS